MNVTDNCQVVVDGDRAVITIDRGLYPMDAVYAASYVFIDRCFVLLDSPDENHLSIALRGRRTQSIDDLKELAGTFGNELLTQVWRQRTVEQNRVLIEATVGRAVNGAVGPAGLDDLADLDLGGDADAFDDPLGIAVPWEEKYGPEASKAAQAEEPAPAGDSEGGKTGDAGPNPR